MARETGTSEREALRLPPVQLLQRYEWAQEARWTRTVEHISAVEAGTMRALAAALGGKKKLPELPSYGEIAERNRAQQRPAWWDEYAAANPGKVKL